MLPLLSLMPVLGSNQRAENRVDEDTSDRLMAMEQGILIVDDIFLSGYSGSNFLEQALMLAG